MPTLFDREWSKAELMRHVGAMDQLAGIRLVEAGDGKGRGCRMLDTWTGTGFRFMVNADRALDITNCEYKGIPIAWHSPSGNAHPAFYEPHGLGWLRSFPGGMMVTCGLDQFGSPAQDGGVELGLHGRISNLPATQVNTRTFWDGEEYKLEISGEIRQAALFFENLVLQRRITTALGSKSLRIEDVVTNDGFEPSPHMILYHFNLGFPIVSEYTQLHLQAKSTQPRDADAQVGLENWEHFQLPTPGYREQVFIHRPRVDRDGNATVVLNNPQMGSGVRWTYDATALPYLMEWKMMGEGAYVVGIEPANCIGTGGRAATREMGQLPVIKPGESRHYSIELEVISSQHRDAMKIDPD
jgi:hypothetical protein